MSLSNNCANKNIPYCEQRKERIYKKRQNFWENGYTLYLHNETWDYDFTKEGTVGDCEQSFLSQMIFGHLLKVHGYNDFSVNRNYMFVNRNDNKKILFHFDLMNNPKKNHKLGMTAAKKVECKREIWEKRYHTIGNFSPIPWPEDLQRKHNGFQERWDKLLEYCKNNWVEWECKDVIDISFNEYMMRTCQHLYFNEIFSDFRNEYGNKLDEITQKKWEELVQGWNNKIDENKCIDIISFEGNIEEIVENINILIEARGRCIVSLLRQELSKGK